MRAHFTRAAEAGDLPSVQEIVHADIPYLDATIEEIHRLGGTVSSNVRMTLCDTQILGYYVPKGTDVFMVSSSKLPSALNRGHKALKSNSFVKGLTMWLPLSPLTNVSAV